MSAIPNTGSLRQLVRNTVKAARLPELRHADLIAETVPLCQLYQGEAGRVMVPSRTQSEPWVVDAFEYSCTGSCACLDFTCNHEPWLSGKKGNEGYSPKRRCFHIVCAIEYLHLQKCVR